MGMMEIPTYDNKNAASVTVALGKNPCELYEHQVDAMMELNKINRKSHFSALIVLPTGAGKTRTATYWLLKNAVNVHKKVLWIAHRHLLLDQAAESFVSNGYSDLLTNRTNDAEKAALGKIFPDDIIYSIDLDTLIKKALSKISKPWITGWTVRIFSS